MKFYEEKNYLGIALDPIHVGAGGYRLSRVDNTIVRDPATDIPKIPGTSIAGVIREYATLFLMEKNSSETQYKRESAERDVSNYFGDDSRQGSVRFYDAQIIFFPVSSTKGTIWLTTPQLIEYWSKKSSETQHNNNFTCISGEKAYAIKGLNNENNSINLGWLLLEFEEKKFSPSLLLYPLVNKSAEKIVVLNEKLFSQIINDNLEVRTSVRIDPKTGAAEDRGLFTYEAIPRTTIFGFEIGIDKRRNRENNKIEGLINSSFKYLKLLGIGGMGTRGFGRIMVEEIKDLEEKKG